MKNNILTQLDPDQINRRSFNEEYDSIRVSIVSGEVPNMTVNVNADEITAAITKGLATFSPRPTELPVTTVKEHITQLKIVEIPTIIKEQEIKIVEVPTTITRVEYKEIQVPVVSVQVVEIEKPIYITQFKELATKETIYLRIIVIVQTALILMSLFKQH